WLVGVRGARALLRLRAEPCALAVTLQRAARGRRLRAARSRGRRRLEAAARHGRRREPRRRSASGRRNAPARRPLDGGPRDRRAARSGFRDPSPVASRPAPAPDRAPLSAPDLAAFTSV